MHTVLSDLEDKATHAIVLEHPPIDPFINQCFQAIPTAYRKAIRPQGTASDGGLIVSDKPDVGHGAIVTTQLHNPAAARRQLTSLFPRLDCGMI